MISKIFYFLYLSFLNKKKINFYNICKLVFIGKFLDLPLYININKFGKFYLRGKEDANHLIEEFIKPYSVVKKKNLKLIDCGGFIGSYTLKHLLANKDLKAVVIEPNSENYKILQKNFIKFSNVKLLNLCIWSEDNIRLYENEYIDKVHGILKQGTFYKDKVKDKELKKLSVNSISINTVLKKYFNQQVDHIKFDIENSEKQVLEVNNNWIDAVSSFCFEVYHVNNSDIFKNFLTRNKNKNVFLNSREKIFVINQEKKIHFVENL